MPLRELAELVHSWTKLFSDLDAECKVSTARPPAVTPRNATPLVTSAHSVGATRPGRGVCRLLSTSRRDGRGRGRHHTAVSRAGAQGGRGVAAPPGWRDSPGATPRLRVADTERLPAAAPALVTLKTEVRSHGQPPPRGARPGLQGTRALVPSAGHARPHAVCRAHTPPAPPRCSSQGHAHSSGRTLGRELGVLSGERGWPGRVRPLCSWALSSASSRQRAACSAQSQRRARRLACCARAPEASLAGCALLRHDDLSRAVVVDRQTRAVGLLG